MVDKCEPRTFIVHCVLHVRFLPACHGDHSNACPLPPWLTHRYFNHVLEGREKQRQARDLRFVSRCIVHAAIDVDVPGNFNGGYSRCVGGFRTETTFDQKFLNRFLSEMVLQRFNGISHKISSDGFLTSHKTRQEQCSDKLASDFIPWMRTVLVASITQFRFNDGTRKQLATLAIAALLRVPFAVNAETYMPSDDQIQPGMIEGDCVDTTEVLDSSETIKAEIVEIDGNRLITEMENGDQLVFLVDGSSDNLNVGDELELKVDNEAKSAVILNVLPQDKDRQS
jgi:hypothetical protein